MMMPVLMRLKRACGILRHVTIEPIVFMIFVAFSSIAVSEHTLLYKTVCLQNFGHLDVDCQDLTKDPVLEDNVQKIASTWTIFLSLGYVIPAIAAQNFLGALSDLYGRKLNILLGFAGLTLTIVPDLFLIAYPHLPLYILVISNVLAGFTGYAATVLLSCVAFLADTVPDERSLTFRMTLVSVCKYLGALCGAFLSGALANFVRMGTIILVSQMILVIGFFYALWIIPNGKDTQRTGKSYSSNVPTAERSNSPSTSLPKRAFELARSVVKMNQEVIKTLAKRRRYHRRVYLLLCMMTYFCYTMSELGLQHGPIMSLYLFRRPFNWSPAELGTYKGVQHTFALAGNICGAILIKKSRFQVTAIMLLALASGFSFLLLTGLANSDPSLYIASALGSFSGLLVPSMKSFITRHVEPDEVGKVLAANGIAADIALVLTTLVFTTIYNATMVVFAGFVFLLGALVVAGCFCCTAWVHLDWEKQKRRIEKGRENCVATAATIVSPTDSSVKCFT